MMRHRRTAKNPSIHVDMTPMVDVMMLLVIFFIMSSVFIVDYPGFSVNLPQVTASKLPTEDMTVMIGKDGQLAVDGQAIDKTILVNKISEVSQQKNSNSVVIRADTEVNYGEVVAVMGDIKKSGITKISVAVEDKG